MAGAGQRMVHVGLRVAPVRNSVILGQFLSISNVVPKVFSAGEVRLCHPLGKGLFGVSLAC